TPVRHRSGALCPTAVPLSGSPEPVLVAGAYLVGAALSLTHMTQALLLRRRSPGAFRVLARRPAGRLIVSGHADASGSQGPPGGHAFRSARERSHARFRTQLGCGSCYPEPLHVAYAKCR